MSQNEIATDTDVEQDGSDGGRRTSGASSTGTDEVNEVNEKGHPNEHLLWKNLPRNEEVDGVEDMVRAHICTPDNGRDLLVASIYHESMKGYVEMAVWEFHEDGGYAGNFGYSRWNKAVSSFQVRSGNMNGCNVCNGTAVEQELIAEVIECIDPIDVARSKPKLGIVYLNNHGQTASSEEYSVSNSTGAWTEGAEIGFNALVQSHPYVYLESVDVAEGSDSHHLPDEESLRVKLDARYPDPTPEVMIE